MKIIDSRVYKIFVLLMIIIILYRPSSSENEGLKDEEEAEQKGRAEEDCAKLYNCTRQFLNDISELADEF